MSTDPISSADALPLQVTLHNATVVLSSFLLATIVAYLVFQLYRLRVYISPLPRPLRNLLWFMFAEPRPTSLNPLVSLTISFTIFFFMTYVVSRYWMASNPPMKRNPTEFNGIATMIMHDGSKSTMIFSDQDALSTFLVSSLGDFASATWEIDWRPQSSTATPTLA